MLYLNITVVILAVYSVDLTLTNVVFESSII